MRHFLCIAMVLLLAGCGLYPTEPMETMEFRAAEKPANHLVVLLAGRGASASYFRDQEWVAIARDHGVDVDFIAPYAHYGYYVTDVLVKRLNEDVIEPARQQGYQSISLVGISMGGFGSIMYSERFPQKIDQLILIAPYLGNKEVQNEIRASGGLGNWQMKKENADKWNHYMWQRLKELTTDPAKKNKIYLGYGDMDKMRGLDLLEENIPHEHVITVPGAHKDVVFTRLWEIMVEKGFLRDKAYLSRSP
jgi:pimeloyl-ACP methyl ester carboxylesterase